MEDEYKVKTDEYGTYHYKNGIAHKEDGPAIELTNGYKSWWINGKRHREDGPACICEDGSQNWYLNGLLHRENNLPAIENMSFGNEWWVNGIRHRENGPAIEYKNGYKVWYINCNNITKEVEEWMTSNDIPEYTLWTSKEIALFKLKFL